MRKKTDLPFNVEEARELLEKFGSPLYVYDEAEMVARASEMKNAFSWANGYRNFFAVKATPTPEILRVLSREGMGFDCSSRTELILMQKLGVPGEDIFYTSNNTPKEDFMLALNLGATINLDDLSQIPVFIEALQDINPSILPRVAARYNPGDLKSGNSLIGEPMEAKYGMSLSQLTEAFVMLKGQGLSEFGLHTMVASNELNPQYFGDTANILLRALGAIEKAVDIKFKFINLGGGFGLNYRIDQEPFDVHQASLEVKKAFKKYGRTGIQIYTENGRFVTGSSGYLISRVRYVMKKYKSYIGLDASMQNLMRPGMYGAYHHITVLGKEKEDHVNQYDVVGSLCENNDKFAIDRLMPEIEAGDIIVIHDAGAHGHAMGFNYNGLLRSAEVLLRGDSSKQLIRRAETVDDLLSTVIW